MMMKPLYKCICVFLIVSFMSCPALAGTKPDPSPDNGDHDSQSAVKDWLDLQSSGQAASGQAQPLSGPVMDRVQERYLKSFSHPVPPFFEHVQPINK